MKKLLLIAISFLLAVSASAEGGLKHVSPESVGMDSRKLCKADSVFEAAIAEKNIPGGVLAIVRHGKIAWLKAYGNKSLVPSVKPAETGTMYDLASVSKCVGTTLSFMQLIENGSVRLTDNVDMYIPGFKPWVDPETRDTVDITIQQLLTHSSGIAPYIDVKSYVSEYGENSPDSLMSYIATRVKRNFRPGTRFMYSCLNFVTLQNILQRLTGERLCDYAQTHVFDVLGLEHTCYFPLVGKPSSRNSAALAAQCAPTEVQADGLPLVASVHDPIARRINGGNSGNAGVFSNAEDLCVIAACLMNGGSWNGHRILSEQTVNTMFTIPEDDDPKVGRVLGWDCRSAHSGPRGDLLSRTRTIEHTGYTGPSIVMDLENDVAIIILTNRVHPKDTGGVGRLRAVIANIVAGSLEK